MRRLNFTNFGFHEEGWQAGWAEEKKGIQSGGES